jgi:hypothetical protein
MAILRGAGTPGYVTVTGRASRQLRQFVTATERNKETATHTQRAERPGVTFSNNMEGNSREYHPAAASPLWQFPRAARKRPGKRLCRGHGI